jgi:hypothetical protein
VGIETIQSHMVSLGFSVDQKSYGDTTKALSNLEQVLSQFASKAAVKIGEAALALLGLEKAAKSVHVPKLGAGGSGPGGSASHADPLKSADASAAKAKETFLAFGASVAKAMGEASLAFASFSLAVVGGTVSILNGLGNQEISMEMLARTLWTTQQQAQAFSYSLKVLGANLQDLYLSPTLLAQYEKLHAVAMQMQTPADYNQQIGLVQNVSLQIKQMQLEAYYALQWIGYYFIKYMSGPIQTVQNVLQGINGAIVHNMPTWTKQVATVMVSFFTAGQYIVQALDGVYKWLEKLLAYVPGWSKAIGAALLIVGASNPFFLLMEGLAGVVLLLDDFETYVHGGKSALGPFWASLHQVFGGMASASQPGGALASLVSLFRSLGRLLNASGIAWQNFSTVIAKSGALAGLVGSMEQLAAATSKLFALFSDNQNLQGIETLGTVLGNILSFLITGVDEFIAEVSSIITIFADYQKGNWVAAGQAAIKMFNSQNLTSAGVPNWLTGRVVGTPPASSSSSKTVHVSQTNHIHGVSDPRKVGEHSGRVLNRQIHNLRSVIG